MQTNHFSVPIVLMRSDTVHTNLMADACATSRTIAVDAPSSALSFTSSLRCSVISLMGIMPLWFAALRALIIPFCHLLYVFVCQQSTVIRSAEVYTHHTPAHRQWRNCGKIINEKLTSFYVAGVFVPTVAGCRMPEAPTTLWNRRWDENALDHFTCTKEIHFRRQNLNFQLAVQRHEFVNLNISIQLNHPVVKCLKTNVAHLRTQEIDGSLSFGSRVGTEKANENM